MDIPAGTTALDAQGTPLTSVSCEIVAELPAAPQEQNVIGLAYDLESSGATFDPPISLTFEYDPTVDPYTSWLPSLNPDFTADPDLGRPLELFGVGFRCDFTPSTFPENGPFCDNCNCFPPSPCREVRCVYPVDFAGACVARDISNNVDDGFDPTPFGVATPAAVVQSRIAALNPGFTITISESA